MRMIDAFALEARMYHDAFEVDSDMQKWDSGCWIRYKMFENAIKEAPTIEERKTGKWEQDPLAKALDVYICSECKQPLQCRGEYGSLAKVNFCPTCGARMER